MRIALLALLLAGEAHAAGWAVGEYTRPDSVNCRVYGVLCENGVCNAKTIWGSAYGSPVAEGAPGSRVPFRVSLSSAAPLNVTLEIVRENIETGLPSPRSAIIRITSQQRSDTLMAWARPDTALVAWARPVSGTSPLGATYAYTFGQFEQEDVSLVTQSVIQYAIRYRLIELFGGWYIGGQWRVDP